MKTQHFWIYYTLLNVNLTTFNHGTPIQNIPYRFSLNVSGEA